MAVFTEIEKFLKQKGIEFKIINLPSTAVSTDDVIILSAGQAVEEEIIKTLIVKNNDGEFVCCLLKGRDKINMKKGNFHRLATKEEVLKISGVDFGAVCPILIGIPVIIDAKVMTLERVNLGSGDHLKGLEIKLKDLIGIIEYTTKSICL